MREILRDPLRLDHIKEAAARLIDFSAQEQFENISEKDIEYFGIVKLLEIIGEAAYKLTKEFKEEHPATPWKYIVSMRHILVHGYYQINSKDVIKTIKEDIPVLFAQIQQYLDEIALESESESNCES